MDGTNSRIYTLDPARVKPFASQPRRRFRGIVKLAESIREVGQVTPIIVTGCRDNGYDAELVDGERRLRACLAGGLRVRAVFENGRAEDRFVRSVAANFCRQDHDPIEILDTVSRLKATGRTNEQIARIFGKTATWVAQYLSLRRLAPELLEKLKKPDDAEGLSRKARKAAGKLPLHVALLLVSLPASQQIEALRKIETARMRAAQARTFVRKFAAGHGVHVGKHQSNYSRFHALRAALETCSHHVERYLRMPGVEIEPMLRSASRQEKRKLADLLESLCESLLMLSDALGK